MAITPFDHAHNLHCDALRYESTRILDQMSAFPLRTHTFDDKVCNDHCQILMSSDMVDFWSSIPQWESSDGTCMYNYLCIYIYMYIYIYIILVTVDRWSDPSMGHNIPLLTMAHIITLRPERQRDLGRSSSCRHPHQDSPRGTSAWVQRDSLLQLAQWWLAAQARACSHPRCRWYWQQAHYLHLTTWQRSKVENEW